ncbi:hypothetical protein T265_03012 [Opisthorchis viverrini]|uniref:Uncharacterized protein n=1 Tax=Opisthorchis viverrini TaxID=6198 RepID=A0A074ZTT0_OPIVI|nr:hypothetical protein T265_03012 [Opisthorchis viverrini]KER30526.1 hypothetical protein T265_03012 [Opisthorchis viverrini]
MGLKLEWSQTHRGPIGSKFKGFPFKQEEQGYRLAIIVPAIWQFTWLLPIFSKRAAYMHQPSSPQTPNNDFCTQLDRLLLMTLKLVSVVVAADLNAGVGRPLSERDQFGGPHELNAQRDDNGERLLRKLLQSCLRRITVPWSYHSVHTATEIALATKHGDVRL